MTDKPWATLNPKVEEHIQACVRMDYANLYYEMGVGKCVSALEIYKRRKEAGQVKTLLILAPPKVAVGTWPAEINKWANYSHFKFRTLYGPKGRHNAVLPADIYICPFTSLRWLPAIREQFDMIIVDEGQMIKEKSNFTTKATLFMGQRAKYRYLLTGNPRGEHLYDLFTQIKFLDHGKALGEKYGEFFGRFLRKNGPFEVVNQDGAAEMVADLIAPFSFRLSLEEAGIVMPPLERKTVEVILSAKDQQAYDTLEAKYFVELKEGKITAANAAVASGKCRQFAGGAIYNSIGTTTIIHDAKIKALQDLAARGKPLMVAYEYSHHRDQILKAFPNARAFTDADSVADLQLRWNCGEIDMLLVQYQSGSRGLNLQGIAADVVKYGPTWSADNTSQITRRVWRRGQQHPVTEWTILAKDTIDEVVLRRSEGKISSQEDFFQLLHQYREKKTMRPRLQ